MKVTALIDDQIVEDVKKLTNADTITESLVIALKDWISIKRLKNLSEDLKEAPVQFRFKDPAKKTRSLSRRRKS